MSISDYLKEGAYSRSECLFKVMRLFDDPMSRIGGYLGVVAYCRERLIEALEWRHKYQIALEL